METSRIFHIENNILPLHLLSPLQLNINIFLFREFAKEKERVESRSGGFVGEDLVYLLH